MTRDDILCMVNEACNGKAPDGWGVMLDHDQLEKFALLVAAAEREIIAEMLDKWHNKAEGRHNYYQFAANVVRGRDYL